MPIDQQNLELVLRSHFPIVVIETHDEQRVTRLLRTAVAADNKLGQLFIWSAAEGLNSGAIFESSTLKVEGLDYQLPDKAAGSTDPELMLKKIKDELSDCLILLPDFHSYLTNPVILRLIKEIGQQYYVKNTTLVFVSHAFSVPDEIERMCTYFDISMPSVDKMLQLIEEEASIWSRKNSKKVKADSRAIKLLANNLVGLTVSDAKRFIRNAIYDDGAITHSDVKEVMEAKYKMVAKDGVLTYEYDTASFAEIGGFNRLKNWLEIRKPFFVSTQDNNDSDIPRGLLLLGVQGCGKSLAAKAVAGVWGVPLLKLDFGALYNKYIGETEKNIREALGSAEILAPCVLWVDEIEKAIQGSGDDTGTSNRILGTLLTWMAENNAHVFIVATSNDIEKLPPELMRKGRLDEIFFVDLPDPAARKAIFELHLQKRNFGPECFNVDQLVTFTEGFSGAEIEQAIVSSRYVAHAENVDLQTEHIIREIKNTRPLSIVRAEAIGRLRSWARERTVSVD